MAESDDEGDMLVLQENVTRKRDPADKDRRAIRERMRVDMAEAAKQYETGQLMQSIETMEALRKYLSEKTADADCESKDAVDPRVQALITLNIALCIHRIAVLEGKPLIEDDERRAAAERLHQQTHHHAHHANDYHHHHHHKHKEKKKEGPKEREMAREKIKKRKAEYSHLLAMQINERGITEMENLRGPHCIECAMALTNHASMQFFNAKMDCWVRKDSSDMKGTNNTNASAGDLAIEIAGKRQASNPDAVLCTARRALQVKQIVYDADSSLISSQHPHIIDSMNLIASILFDTRKYAEAAEILEKCVPACKKTFGESSFHTSVVMKRLADCYRRIHRRQDGQALLEKSMMISDTVSGVPQPSTALTIDYTANMLEEMVGFIKHEAIKVTKANSKYFAAASSPRSYNSESKKLAKKLEEDLDIKRRALAVAETKRLLESYQN